MVSEETIDGTGAETSSTTMAYDTDAHISAINLLQSVFLWIGNYMMKSYQPINADMIRLIPQLCSVDKVAAQEVTLKVQLPIIRMFMSVWIMDQSLSNIFMDQIEKVKLNLK